jgi:polysaccharide export outer membrane protein
MAGGVRNDAGYTVKITRNIQWGEIPLSGAKTDDSGQFSVAEVELKAIMSARNPRENILIQPNDVVSVPRGELVYVIGEVSHPGGFVLAEREAMSVLQALALAGGLNSHAAGKHGKILRGESQGGPRTEIAINVNEILSGRAKDVPLGSDDILFIPSNVPKKAASRVLESGIQITTGLILYRR